MDRERDARVLLRLTEWQRRALLNPINAYGSKGFIRVQNEMFNSPHSCFAQPAKSPQYKRMAPPPTSVSIPKGSPQRDLRCCVRCSGPVQRKSQAIEDDGGDNLQCERNYTHPLTGPHTRWSNNSSEEVSVPLNLYIPPRYRLWPAHAMRVKEEIARSCIWKLQAAEEEWG